MTEQPQSPENGQQADESVPGQEPVTQSDWSPVAVPDDAAPPPASAVPPPPPQPGSAQPVSAPAGPSAADRPEVAVGAAFAGGALLALILKRLAR